MEFLVDYGIPALPPNNFGEVDRIRSTSLGSINDVQGHGLAAILLDVNKHLVVSVSDPLL
jgi:hypothetical protein